MSLVKRTALIIIFMLLWVACKDDNQKEEPSKPLLNIEVLLDCNNTFYTQVLLAEKINTFNSTPEVWELMNRAVSDTLSENTIASIYREFDKYLHFDSLFVATTGYNPSDNIITAYAYDIFKLDLATGIIHMQCSGMSTAQQGRAKIAREEFEKQLMMKYYRLLYDKIKDFHVNRDPERVKPSNAYLLLEKNQKQWEELNKQKEELFWRCFENEDGNWCAVSYPALGYYRERISFLFDCYLNYSGTTRYNYHIK